MLADLKNLPSSGKKVNETSILRLKAQYKEYDATKVFKKMA